MQEEIQTGSLTKIFNHIIHPMLEQISEPGLIIKMKCEFEYKTDLF